MIKHCYCSIVLEFKCVQVGELEGEGGVDGLHGLGGEVGLVGVCRTGGVYGLRGE